MKKEVYVIVEMDMLSNFKRLVCAFDNREKAKEYAQELSKKHNLQSVFEEELWNDIEEEIIDLFDSLDDEVFINPYDGGSDEWEQWNEEFEVFEKEKYLELLHKRGLTNATIEDVEKQIDYNFYKDKEIFVKIEELTLFEEDEQ